MTQFTCPHCGGLCKIIPQRNHESSSHTFESTATFGKPPKNAVTSFLWFLRGNKAKLPDPNRQSVTVKIETWDYTKNEVRFHDMDERVTFKVVKEIAQMITTGHEWSRDNLVKHTTLSENKVRVYQREFKRLNYLQVTPNNRSEITSTGRRFLRGVLAMKSA